MTQSFPERLTRFSIWLLFFSCFCSASGIGVATALLLVGSVWYFRAELARIPFVPLFGPIAAIGAAVGVSVLLADGHGYGKSVLKLKYFGVYLLLVIAFLRFTKLPNRLARAGAFFSFLLAVVAFLQFTGIWEPQLALHMADSAPAEIAGTRFFHARGLLYHHNPFAYGCVLLFFLALGQWLGRSLERKERQLFLGAALASACGVALSASRGAWFALVLSCLVVWAAAARERWRAFAIGAAVLFVLLLPFAKVLEGRLETVAHPDQNNHRLGLWRISWQMFRDKPIFGHGYHHSFALERERYMTDAEKADESFPNEPHSVYFDFLGSTGIVGFAALLWFIVAGWCGYVRSLAVSPPGEEFAAVRPWLITGLGAFTAFTIGAAFDSHLFHTQTLNATLFFLALGQAAVYQTAHRAVRRAPTA